MGQKVNPHGLRVGVIQNWDSRWYAKNEKVGDLLVEDFKIRKFIKDTLYEAGIPKIEIERNPNRVRIFIHCARPGIVIGRGGADIEKLRLTLEEMIGKRVAVNIVEIRNPDINAQLVAESIASQLEKRVSFRRAMKQSMGRATRAGVRGIKTSVSGRLGGAEIARTEHYHEGTIPLQTLRADIDYGFAEAKTQYGRIGVKVWIYRGEILTGGPRQSTVEAPRNDRRDRRDRRDNRNGDRRGGFNRGPREGGQGFNRGPREGGFNRGQGGQGRPQNGQGYNRGAQGGNRPQGGFNRGPRPAAPAAKPEGGNN
ncbi:MAG: 30S ribosomal protein S3 [Ruminococcaceae bacterium]|nr:30S ribosomal protein S3 [Oscillospiraceae bacterium]